MDAVNNPALIKFFNVYAQLGKENLAQLADVYHHSVIFEDPAHKIEGFTALEAYFFNLYQNINSCRFVINSYVEDDHEAFVQWTMHFSHPRLQNGKERSLEGCTQLKFEQEKVIYHRDYFDMGEMIYEGLPMFGRIIRHIKARLGQS
ncbi:nuclear transport factor 2 family protein [Photobacterium leiognathi]|uniref:nuclear transport factor 2 family protein n=1 Tax=Photobacterium leiognathi TaxID=553611 RepID=UPI000D168B2B|nr:nuclear transport factor 2 family protein [Photobacterium leiognathi]PSW57977.1 transcriptional regulator [Photobacterium leiognathi subsp. mandapamensis]